MKNFLFSFCSLLIVWLLLNMSLSSEYVISGFFVSFFLSVWSTKSFPIFASIRLSSRLVPAFIMFIFVFMIELIKSNIDVAMRVFSPSLPIKPGIVEVTTSLKSPIARLMLANAITLTPGTLTVETKGNRFFIHWLDGADIDATKRAKQSVRKFEKYLEVIYV